MFLQWVPWDMEPAREFKMMVRTFLEAFPKGTLWGGQDAHLIAAKGDLRTDLAAWEQRLRDPWVRYDLREGGWDSAAALSALFLLDARSIRTFVGDVPIITDDRPTIEFSIPRYIHSTSARGQRIRWDEVTQLSAEARRSKAP